MAEKQYDWADNGTPNPSHYWEEQFKGRRGPPPTDALEKRIALLQKYLDENPASPVKSRVTQELQWRKRQLESQK